MRLYPPLSSRTERGRGLRALFEHTRRNSRRDLRVVAQSEPPSHDIREGRPRHSAIRGAVLSVQGALLLVLLGALLRLLGAAPR
jgi:hypothetical protein